MNLSFDLDRASGYKAKPQIIRILSEDWVLTNSYCPRCGYYRLQKFRNNRPVADFCCRVCSEEFELKSKFEKLTNTIIDGAYSKMIERINSKNNPNFFFLTYTRNWSVNDFFIIPKQFFTEEIILKRSPLPPTARRAGWIGCNIDIAKVPESGKVYLVKQSKIIDRKIVKQSFNKTLFLREKSIDAKGWLLDIMKCVDEIKSDVFKLDEIYNFENKLKLKYPNNNFIKDKIRQQLQILRDNGIIEFVGRGKYRKLKPEIH
ncbi:MAG: restriction endonuclease [Ignavibacterium album]|uniref:DpnI domain-containing protein n=1 Tax=Ignavibacterium album TaxID=591197 RepID=UPI0026E9C978|nr:DpnI domain-containing protein [Ignavibacterium album]MBI5662295.1 restriction endonuclease [Ignavibacterium album]